MTVVQGCPMVPCDIFNQNPHDGNYWVVVLMLQLLTVLLYPFWKRKFIAGHKNATYGSTAVASQFLAYGPKHTHWCKNAEFGS